MNSRDSKYWIEKLSLIPHREGGHFSEIYRCDESAIVKRVGEASDVKRNFSTAIYFLLRSGEMNALHRIKSDEVWHFYDGSPLIVYEIDPDGNLKENILGLNAEKGERPVIVIKAGNWFCAELMETDSFTLAGCTVSPGFDFEDFELANRSELSESFPQHKEFIEKFTQ